MTGCKWVLQRDDRCQVAGCKGQDPPQPKCRLFMQSARDGRSRKVILNGTHTPKHWNTESPKLWNHESGVTGRQSSVDVVVLGMDVVHGSSAYWVSCRCRAIKTRCLKRKQSAATWLTFPCDWRTQLIEKSSKDRKKGICINLRLR